ncbi:MAG: heme-binding beta-barrel domain-containing protein [Acidimicrobiales bacterium]
MEHWGPLAALAGEWEGDDGLDVSYHHAEGEVGETPYRETISFKPFGPVDNGTQSLFGLDYRMAAWRADEEDPFHTEVGYWLWCADLGHVMRSFVIPRGSVIQAGGPAAADATTFTMKATSGDEEYGMATNPYLVEKAKCVTYEVTISIDGDTFSYEEDSVLDMVNIEGLFHHTDRNTLRRVAQAEFPPVD